MTDLRSALSLYDTETAARILNSDALFRTRHVREKWSGIQGNEFKYLDAGAWMRKYVYMARTMLLHKDTGRKILDIGAGPGWMSWIANRLGHCAEGIDQPDAPPVYKEMCQALDVPVRHEALEAMKPAPAGRGYNIVVALMASFNLYRPEWDAQAFSFLLRDLDARVSRDHVALFEMNHCCGQYFSKEIFDVFIGHGYRICDNFAFRAGGSFRIHEKFLHNSFSRFHRLKDSPWRGIWHYEVPECVLLMPGIFLDNLLADFPGDPDILSHKALFSALSGSPENVRGLLERIPAFPHAGNSVLFAQACLSTGDHASAARAVAELLAAYPESSTGREWDALLSIDSGRPACEASEQWNARYYLLKHSRIFVEMCKFITPHHDDPVSWYLRRGIVESGLNPAFTPAVYWGLNNDVFKSGVDPLAHYIESGEADGRAFR